MSSGNRIFLFFFSHDLFLSTISFSSSSAKAAAILWSNPSRVFIKGNELSLDLMVPNLTSPVSPFDCVMHKLHVQNL
ncbi:MAG: hypothetical protein EA359_12430 [Balneolaceae bacterium]|nr:MAG: hypothetical protein EA359_12430 [Balneolaceae bacterium]